MRRLSTGMPVEALRNCTTTSDQVQRATRHLEKLLRTQPKTAVTGPADLYYLLGVCEQIVTSFQQSFSHIANWLDDHQTLGRLAVDRGPFTGEADAAVHITVHALADARRASSELRDALTRAQLAITDLHDVGLGPIARR